MTKVTPCIIIIIIIIIIDILIFYVIDIFMFFSKFVVVMFLQKALYGYATCMTKKLAYCGHDVMWRSVVVIVYGGSHGSWVCGRV
jgi:hypothetical protein